MAVITVLWLTVLYHVAMHYRIVLPKFTGDINGSVRTSSLVDKETDISTTFALTGIR